MSGSTHVIFGCSGPAGYELMCQLVDRGIEPGQIIGACRRGQAEAPAGVHIVPGDAAHAEDTLRLCRGAAIVYCCVGVPYPAWSDQWPAIVRALLEGAASAQAKLVFADNLYSYGPQTSPLREDMPLTTFGRKPAQRARLAAMMLDAHQRGRVQVALVRASDFYGPRVRGAMLGERVFLPALGGKPAQVFGDVKQPHTFTHIRDFGRALVDVALAADAYGQIWHVPNAPAAPLQEALETIYRLAGHPAKWSSVPWPMMQLLGLTMPLLRELGEMRFQWDRPYLVDHSKFAARFWSDPAPFAQGLAETLEWYRQLPPPASPK